MQPAYGRMQPAYAHMQAAYERTCSVYDSSLQPALLRSVAPALQLLFSSVLHQGH